MRAPTALDERRSGVRWVVGGGLLLVAMLCLWWLVEETNEDGTHDAEILPFLALVPLAIGVHHLVHARLHHG